MKILVYLYYVLRSVILRGPLGAYQLMRDEFRYEKIFGIKTAAIKTSNSVKFHDYQGAGYRILRRLFKEVVPHTHNYEFVDIGCGKGRAIFVAENFGYDQLTGIDLDEALIVEAEDNLKKYALKRESSVIKFIHANALDYNYTGKPTVYFLFNPFNEEVLREVLNKICSQTQSETWFVYMNPIHKRVFAQKQIIALRAIKTGFYLEALIYRINPGKGH